MRERIFVDEQQLVSLMQSYWEEISSRVLRSALFLAAFYGWNADSSLPKGKSVEDLVMDAISDLFAKPERRNPDCSLVTQLKNMVRSKLWNLSQSPDEEVERSESMAEIALAKEPGPGADIEVADQFSRALELLALHPKVKGKSDHELVLLAFYERIFDVAEIVEKTGLSRDRIYQVRRELRDVYPAIAAQLEEQEDHHEST
jgi:hypothetical protein